MPPLGWLLNVDIEFTTGVRVLVPASGLGGGGTAIDELEVYGSPIPEPTSAVLALLAAIGMLAGGRRSRRRLA